MGGLSQGANKQEEGRVSRKEHDGRKEGRKLHGNGGLDQLWRSHGKGLSHRHGEVIGNFKLTDDTLIIFFRCDPGWSVGNKF